MKQGAGYDGRFGIIMDGDLEKLAGWSGAKVHASIHSIFGTQYSAANLDNLMLVSNVEAPPTVRLFSLWIEQNLTSRINLRVGQFTAAQEFIVSKNADLFINSTFGWPMLNTQDLPSGGPNYPEAALGGRLQVTFNDQFILRAAIFDGDPAGSGSNNPITTDKYGVAFRVNDPPFMIVEAVYGYGGARLIGAQQNPNQEGNGLPAADEEGPRLAASPSALPGVIKIGAMPVRFPCKTSRKAACCRRRSEATPRSMAYLNRRSGACPAAPTARSVFSRAESPRPATAASSIVMSMRA